MQRHASVAHPWPARKQRPARALTLMRYLMAIPASVSVLWTCGQRAGAHFHGPGPPWTAQQSPAPNSATEQQRQASPYAAKIPPGHWVRCCPRCWAVRWPRCSWPTSWPRAGRSTTRLQTPWRLAPGRGRAVMPVFAALSWNALHCQSRNRSCTEKLWLLAHRLTTPPPHGVSGLPATRCCTHTRGGAVAGVPGAGAPAALDEVRNMAMLEQQSYRRVGRHTSPHAVPPAHRFDNDYAQWGGCCTAAPWRGSRRFAPQRAPRRPHSRPV